MKNVEIDNLLKAGVHFDILQENGTPNMAPYIYEKRDVYY